MTSRPEVFGNEARLAMIPYSIVPRIEIVFLLSYTFIRLGRYFVNRPDTPFHNPYGHTDRQSHRLAFGGRYFCVIPATIWKWLCDPQQALTVDYELLLPEICLYWRLDFSAQSCKDGGRGLGRCAPPEARIQARDVMV